MYGELKISSCRLSEVCAPFALLVTLLQVGNVECCRNDNVEPLHAIPDRSQPCFRLTAKHEREPSQPAAQ